MRSIVFSSHSLAEYENLRKLDNSLHKKLLLIIKEMMRDDPGEGIGKPERLKGDLAGLWSRRISDKDRLVYKFDEERIYIFAIGGHYDD